MNLLQEIICAVWGCNDKVRFTRINSREFSSTTYFCSRCRTKIDTYCHGKMYCVHDEEAEEEVKRVEESNTAMHKKYGYDFKY